MKTLERLLGAVMFLGGIGHGFGSYMAYSKDQMELLWALSASFAFFLLASLNLLRTWRSGDKALAWICLLGCLVQAGFAIWFGRLIGNMMDFRPFLNTIVSLLLAFFSARDLFQRSN
jgi:hypothetical protein